MEKYDDFVTSFTTSKHGLFDWISFFFLSVFFFSFLHGLLFPGFFQPYKNAKAQIYGFRARSVLPPDFSFDLRWLPRGFRGWPFLSLAYLPLPMPWTYLRPCFNHDRRVSLFYWRESFCQVLRVYLRAIASTSSLSSSRATSLLLHQLKSIVHFRPRSPFFRRALKFILLQNSIGIHERKYDKRILSLRYRPRFLQFKNICKILCSFSFGFAQVNSLFRHCAIIIIISYCVLIMIN